MSPLPSPPTPSGTSGTPGNPARSDKRALMHILYALHTLAWLSLGTLTLLALVINYIRREDEPSALCRAHHAYMIRSFWLWVMGLVLSAPLYALFFFPGLLAWGLLSLWYLYRCLRGWMRFSDDALPPTTSND